MASDIYCNCIIESLLDNKKWRKFLSENREDVAVENLEKEIDNVKKSYEIIENYLN